MWKDPIVEKIHRYREARAKKFNYDFRAMYADIKAKEKQYEQAGWKIVSFCASDSNPETDQTEASKDLVETKLSSISNSSRLEQMGEFCDPHDFTEFDDPQRADVKVEFSGAILIEPALFSGIQNVAVSRGIPVETLINLWLQQKLSEQVQAA